MADDIHIDTDFDSIYVNRPASIISEAYRLNQRIELMGLKLISLNYMSGDDRKTQPKINCRNDKQDFSILRPPSPDSRANRQALVMLFLALGKICGIHPAGKGLSLEKRRIGTQNTLPLSLCHLIFTHQESA